MVLQTVLCVALAAAVLGLLWLAAAWLLRPIGAEHIVTLLFAAGDGDTLEQDCRAYLLWRDAGAFCGRLLIVDNGLSEQGRCLAQRVTALDDAIVLIPRSALDGNLVPCEQAPT